MRISSLILVLLGTAQASPWGVPVPERVAYVATWTECEARPGCADSAYMDGSSACGCSRHAHELETRDKVNRWVEMAPTLGWKDVRVYQVARQFDVQVAPKLVETPVSGLSP